MKTKALTSSSTSRRQAEDVEMVDAESHEDGSEAENAVEPQVEEVETDDHSDGDGHSQRQADGGEGEGLAEDDSGSRSADVNGAVSGGTDGPAAMAIFGDYHQFGSYMLSLSSRLKTMLNNIKPTTDPTTRLVTLQELSELLSISTEDTLAGSFQVELFVKELIKILGGRGADGDDEDDADEDQAERDGDAALATALALSTGGTAYQGDDNLEAQVLACRCLANLMEALPGVAHTVVYHGAIPVLCSKLIEISYIDLAEQTLSVSSDNNSVRRLLTKPSRHWKKSLRSSQALLCERVVLRLCSITWISFPSQFSEPLCKLPLIAVVTSLWNISP
jgi:E3 ubiquitin-protein ligase TRIP12